MKHYVFRRGDERVFEIPRRAGRDRGFVTRVARIGEYTKPRDHSDSADLGAQTRTCL